jgi:hypothetical protein
VNIYRCNSSLLLIECNILSDIDLEQCIFIFHRILMFTLGSFNQSIKKTSPIQSRHDQFSSVCSARMFRPVQSRSHRTAPLFISTLLEFFPDLNMFSSKYQPLSRHWKWTSNTVFMKNLYSGTYSVLYIYIWYTLSFFKSITLVVVDTLRSFSQ